MLWIILLVPMILVDVWWFAGVVPQLYAAGNQDNPIYFFIIIMTTLLIIMGEITIWVICLYKAKKTKDEITSGILAVVMQHKIMKNCNIEKWLSDMCLGYGSISINGHAGSIFNCLPLKKVYRNFLKSVDYYISHHEEQKAIDRLDQSIKDFYISK